MKRRRFLKDGAIWCGAAASGYSCLSAPDAEDLAPIDNLARSLFDSLDDSQKGELTVPYDHPLRQYHNRGVSLGGARVGLGSFSWEQLGLLNRLFYQALSPSGREIVPKQFFLTWRGIRTLRLLIAGDPNTSDYQVILSGPHVNLRIGGKNREGVAFGGPMVYGDQRGNNRQGIPKNVYQYQFLQAQELFDNLTPAQQNTALVERAPVQTQIDLQGERGKFPGVPIAKLEDARKESAQKLVDAILDVYRIEDADYARDCLRANGGVSALHLSYYREGEVDGSGQYQIFRLEGPAAVFYFRGYPHVHAFINVGMDPDHPLSVGEEIGTSATGLVQGQVQRLFESAMKDFCGTDFAYYDADSVAGRLRAGTIRTGDIYDLESWNNEVQIVTIRGSAFSELAAARWQERGHEIDASKTYTVATTDNVVDELLREHIGNGRAASSSARLRDVTIDYIRERSSVSN